MWLFVRKEGFTLVELIIVVSIIAILLAIVALSLTGFLGSAEETACEADQYSLQRAVGAFYAKVGEWPTQDGNAPGDLFDASEPLVTDDYILEVPGTDATANWGIDEDDIVLANGSGPCAPPAP